MPRVVVNVWAGLTFTFMYSKGCLNPQASWLTDSCKKSRSVQPSMVLRPNPSSLPKCNSFFLKSFLFLLFFYIFIFCQDNPESKKKNQQQTNPITNHNKNWTNERRKERKINQRKKMYLNTMGFHLFLQSVFFSKQCFVRIYCIGKNVAYVFVCVDGVHVCVGVCLLRRVCSFW